MHIGVQRIGEEALLPLSWGELGDVGGWMLAHELEHADQVIVGIKRHSVGR